MSDHHHTNIEDIDQPIIKVDDLSVSYGDGTAVLWKVSGAIPEGSLVAIVGPNGAGKSTLVKSMMGLIKPTSGKILIKDQPVNQLDDRHKILGYMPQRDSIDDNFPVNCLDVVLMGRYGHIDWFRRPSKKDKQRAMDALKKFDMAEFAKHQIGELSGGQKQRVLLARSYVQDAEILVLDEPFGGIDVKTEEVILDLLKELRDQGKTIIVITHDLASLQDHFDYVWLLNIHTVAFGKPREILNRENLQHCYGGTVHMFAQDELT